MPVEDAIIQKQQLLGDVAKLVMGWHQGRIDHLKQKAEADIARPDFVWHFLLQSFATMGNANGWFGLIGNLENYKQVQYERLANINSSFRLTHLMQVCARAKIRMPNKKADFIHECFKKIRGMGGYTIVKEQLLAQPSREVMIKYLCQFKGIGKKYARNIMMDVHHPNFLNSIAVDSRIEVISKKLELDLASYEDKENFYLGAAKLAGIDGWDLDRLMFNFQGEFLEEITLIKNRLQGE